MSLCLGMSDASLHPYMYAQEIKIHIRVSRKFHFLSQLCDLVGVDALRGVLESPTPIIYPLLQRGVVWEIFVFVLL